MQEQLDRHSPFLRAVFPIIKGFAFFVFAFFFTPVRVSNRKRVPKGPLLVIANHISNSDPVVVQYACPRLLHFLARRDLFTMGLLGRFVRWWGGVPIKQSSADKGAIKRAVELIRVGEAVAIFPEGQLSPDGSLLPLFEGTALIVRMSSAPCICLGVTGSNKLVPYPSVLPRWGFSWIKADWGEPRTFDRDATTEEVMAWIESELKTLTGQA